MEREWYALAVAYLLIAGGILYGVFDLWRHAENPEDRLRLRKALLVSVVNFIAMPVACVMAPTLFAYVRPEAPELAAIEGPLLLVATIGLLPMGMMLLVGGGTGPDAAADDLGASKE